MIDDLSKQKLIKKYASISQKKKKEKQSRPFWGDFF